MRPATNEESRSLHHCCRTLTEAVREGRTRHFADITKRGPEDDEPMVEEGDVMDVRLEFCMTLCTWQHERGALYITFRGTVFGARNAPPERRECLARTGSPTSGDRGQVGTQPFCHESRSRVDQFIHDGRAYPTRSDSQRRTVVQRRAFPFAENCDTR